MIAEERRLELSNRREENWQRWGPYLSERQWGTVREDYSPDGDCWNYFPFDQSASRAYRWGEDGILGFTDRQCRLCFSLAMWNTKDEMLKERMFGLNGFEGNHGEDVKECYYYLSSTPTHSYTKGLYRYPQKAFPYDVLRLENASRNRKVPEYDLEDTGVFRKNRFFDVTSEYAKNGPNDILIRITVENRGPAAAPLHLLPTLWYRNTWIWGCKHEGCTAKPAIVATGDGLLRCIHPTLETFLFAVDPILGTDYLFTENETNTRKLYGSDNYTPYVKDAFNEYVVHGRTDAVSPKPQGTKVAAHCRLSVPAGEKVTLRLRLCMEHGAPAELFGEQFDAVFAERIHEADEFYAAQIPSALSLEEQRVMRLAYSGLLWSKQFYHYVVEDWLKGDPDQPAPPPERLKGRNHDWGHLFNRDIISMPDKWEYPWYASWDTAFHMIPFASIDPHFAKDQLLLFLREWYMHPNGQIPAYEFALDDVNPPVHAWAAWQVYESTGSNDRIFLARVFQKLLINFTWWVNRKDPDGNHVFSGGFLGMDNIGLFNRSDPLPFGDEMEQADGTAWMAFYCVRMMRMAFELAKTDPAAEDTASKFFEHFVAIADAINTMGNDGLWDETDGFYYDQIISGGQAIPLRIRSMVGLIPLLAVDVLDQELIDRLPDFAKRTRWFIEHRQDLDEHISYLDESEANGNPARRLLAIPSRERLVRMLGYMLDEDEFLSPYGIRSLSKYHADHPYTMDIGGKHYEVRYTPGESTTELFGGNSNWRGPVWFPLNYLIICALRDYHRFYGDNLKVECPTGSGNVMTLAAVADEISSRLIRIFMPDSQGHRPVNGDRDWIATDPCWKDLVRFSEYFHGETGRGMGASHQTGWTALVAELLRAKGR